MKELLELVHIVNRNKVKNIEVLDNPDPSKSLVNKLYDEISNGKVKSDEEAAAYIYDSTPADRRYKELKNRLVEKLYNTVLFIDTSQPRYDEMGKAYYNCWKNFAICKVLLGKGSTNAAISLLKKILRKSKKFEFTLLSIEILKLLRLKEATFFINPKKFSSYTTQLREFEELNKIEAHVEETYLLFNLNVLSQNKDHALELASQFIKDNPQLLSGKTTYKTGLFYFSIKLSYEKEKHDFVQAQHTCLEALTFFQSSKKHSQNAIGIFQRQLFLLYWQQKKYEEGEALLKEARNYTRDGDISFFTNHSYYLLLCLHAGKYAKAWDIYQEATGHKRFSTLSEYSREKWTIYETYLHYLGGLDMVPGMEPKKMRIQKFLNEVPIYSRDKSGTNIPILIIQILLLLLYQRYNEVIDRMEALEKYAQRYLRQPATLRSYYFIKMLLKIPVADFHRAGAIRKAAPFRKKLDATPLNVTRQAYVTEIIPYERLWDFAMDSLQNTFWKPRKRSSGR
jgi:hypothetical protein